MAEENILGLAKEIDPEKYGENSASVWSDSTGSYIYASDVPPVQDAAPWSLEEPTEYPGI